MLAARNNVLKAALQIVPQKGFTDATLVDAAAQLNLSPMVVGAMFPRGPVELVEHVMQTANLSVATELAKVVTEQSKTTGSIWTSVDVVKFGLTHRLECIEPFSPHWSVAIALTMNPSSLPRAMLMTAYLVDEIAFHADKSSVPNNGVTWYMRRAVLAGIYGGAELHMLGDSTPRKAQTKLFVNTQVDALWCS
eukprot:PhF_6_TR10104/c0_g1_i1/m.15723/K18587/COQ9; ubiquinone biosynthesis protein COQ9